MTKTKKKELFTDKDRQGLAQKTRMKGYFLQKKIKKKDSCKIANTTQRPQVVIDVAL
jgi:hypothetical protein